MALHIDDILTQALQEIGVLAEGENATAGQINTALSKANRLIDRYAAARKYAFAEAFTLFTLTANHAPHLIGPGLGAPDFAMTPRPVEILGWDLVLNNSAPPVDLPRTRIRDAAWWNNQRVKSLTSNVPTDLYYEADWPNGQLNFWPVPSFNFQVRLQTRNVIAQFALGQAFSLPPGYQETITMDLAKMLCGPFERPWSQTQEWSRAVAEKALFANNDAPPRISTADAGMKSRRGGRRADFNWEDGSVR